MRIDREGYKRYSAALWTYGEEILHRMGFGPSSVEHWTMNYSLDAQSRPHSRLATKRNRLWK